MHVMRSAAYGEEGSPERAMRAQILSVLEELCRDMTLRDAREWYFDSLPEPAPGSAGVLD
ncbi:MAG TPA: hypothetical protein VGF86_10725 [Candidatus Tumulicola sp.]|jgi:hypothetical protein